MQGAFARQRRATTSLVARYGTPAVFRRDDGDRPCLIFESNYSSVEMLGREVEPNTRRVLVAATPEVLATPPDPDRDRLITFTVPPTFPPTEETNFRITDANPIAPNGEVAFWRISVRR
jgi:hypothetical protein